ncbi:MAG: CapA family protein [Bacillota bacterium]
MKKLIGFSVMIALVITVLSGMLSPGDMGVNDATDIADTGENVTTVPDCGNQHNDLPPTEESYISNKNNKSSITILAAGDLMFHIPQINAARTPEGSFDFTPTFQFLEENLSKADLAIANLETVIAGDHLGFSGFPGFNSPEAVLDGIAESGFNVLVTSNNHSLDMGKKGIENTITAIKKREMEYIGTSATERRPYLILERQGIKLGLLSYTYGLNELDTSLSDDEISRMVNMIDKEKMAEDIAKIKSENIDFIVAYLHWGNQYHSNPTDEQRGLARFLAEKGVQLILGTHPHVVQEIETIEIENHTTHVVYSMGNLISNQRYDTIGVSDTEDGVLIQVFIEKDENTGITEISEITPIPTWILRRWNGNSYSYRILPVEKAIEGSLDIELEKHVHQRLCKSLSDTMNNLYK